MNNVNETLSEIDCSNDAGNENCRKQNVVDGNEKFLEQKNTAEGESPDIVPSDQRNIQDKEDKMTSEDETDTSEDVRAQSESESNDFDDENEAQVCEKQPEIDLPDVVPERSETPGKQDEVDIKSADVNGNEAITTTTTPRSILKRDGNKKNLRVSFSDKSVIFVEPDPMPNLMLFLDSNFGIQMEENYWEECENSNETDKENCTEKTENEEASLSSLEQFLMDGNVDSDTETNSSQDTVILMTSEENERNQESIQQSQRRFHLQKTGDVRPGESRMAGLRSNSAVRKCLERTALRRSLTQCAITKRKTPETKPSPQESSSITEKLRLLTGDSDEKVNEEISLPRLDLQQVHEMINKRCPLRDVCSSPKEVDVPGDVREWKLNSKLWEQWDHESQSESVEDSDELEKFVQQDWERIERVRQRYNNEPNDALLELYRRPSVRGIRPRFGSTHEIMNQLQEQLQPPSFRHDSLSNVSLREAELSNAFHPKLSQSFQSLNETKWPLYVTLKGNPNRLSCPPEYFQTNFEPEFVQNSSLNSCENTRFVSDV